MPLGPGTNAGVSDTPAAPLSGGRDWDDLWGDYGQYPEGARYLKIAQRKGMSPLDAENSILGQSIRSPDVAKLIGTDPASAAARQKALLSKVPATPGNAQTDVSGTGSPGQGVVGKIGETLARGAGQAGETGGRILGSILGGPLPSKNGRTMTPDEFKALSPDEQQKARGAYSAPGEIFGRTAAQFGTAGLSQAMNPYVTGRPMPTTGSALSDTALSAAGAALGSGPMMALGAPEVAGSAAPSLLRALGKGAVTGALASAPGTTVDPNQPQLPQLAKQIGGNAALGAGMGAAGFGLGKVLSGVKPRPPIAGLLGPAKFELPESKAAPGDLMEPRSITGEHVAAGQNPPSVEKQIAAAASEKATNEPRKIVGQEQPAPGMRLQDALDRVKNVKNEYELRNTIAKYQPIVDQLQDPEARQKFDAALMQHQSEFKMPAKLPNGKPFSSLPPNTIAQLFENPNTYHRMALMEDAGAFQKPQAPVPGTYTMNKGGGGKGGLETSEFASNAPTGVKSPTETVELPGSGENPARETLQDVLAKQRRQSLVTAYRPQNFPKDIRGEITPATAGPGERAALGKLFEEQAQKTNQGLAQVPRFDRTAGAQKLREISTAPDMPGVARAQMLAQAERRFGQGDTEASITAPGGPKEGGEFYGGLAGVAKALGKGTEVANKLGEAVQQKLIPEPVQRLLGLDEQGKVIRGAQYEFAAAKTRAGKYAQQSVDALESQFLKSKGVDDIKDLPKSVAQVLMDKKLGLAKTIADNANKNATQAFQDTLKGIGVHNWEPYVSQFDATSTALTRGSLNWIRRLKVYRMLTSGASWTWNVGNNTLFAMLDGDALPGLLNGRDMMHENVLKAAEDYGMKGGWHSSSARDLIGRLQNEKNLAGKEGISKLLSHVAEVAGKGSEMAGRAFDAYENVLKLSSFTEKLRSAGLLDKIKAGGELAGDEQQAIHKAVHDVFQFFPNFETSSPLERGLGTQKPLTKLFVNPSLKWTMESGRIWKNAFTQKPATTAAVLLGGVAAMKGMATGVSSQEEEEAKAHLPHDQRMGWLIPYHDEQGKTQFWDASMLIPGLENLSGLKWDPAVGSGENVAKLSLGVMGNLFSGGMVGRANTEDEGNKRPALSSAAGAAVENFEAGDYDSMKHDLGDIARKPGINMLVPPALSHVLNAGRRRFGEQGPSTSKDVAGAFGTPLRTTGPEADMVSKVEMQNEAGSLQKALRANNIAPPENRDLALKQREGQRLNEAIARLRADYAERYGEELQ